MVNDQFGQLWNDGFHVLACTYFLKVSAYPEHSFHESIIPYKMMTLTFFTNTNIVTFT
jgi:hypothetical protein